MSDLKTIIKSQTLEDLEDKQLEEQKYKELWENISDLKDINDELTYLLDRNTEIEIIKDNIMSTDEKVETGLKNLVTTRNLSTRYLPIIGGLTLGALIGGPVGAVAGLKAGAIIGVAAGSGVVGGGLGYGLQK